MTNIYPQKVGNLAQVLQLIGVRIPGAAEGNDTQRSAGGVNLEQFKVSFLFSLSCFFSPVPSPSLPLPPFLSLFLSLSRSRSLFPANARALTPSLSPPPHGSGIRNAFNPLSSLHSLSRTSRRVFKP